MLYQILGKMCHIGTIPVLNIAIVVLNLAQGWKVEMKGEFIFATSIMLVVTYITFQLNVEYSPSPLSIRLVKLLKCNIMTTLHAMHYIVISLIFTLFIQIVCSNCLVPGYVTFSVNSYKIIKGLFTISLICIKRVH